MPRVTTERELRDALALPGGVVNLEIAAAIECDAPVTIADRRAVRVRGDGSLRVREISGLPDRAWVLCLERCQAVALDGDFRAHFARFGDKMRKANCLRVDGCGYVRLGDVRVAHESDEPLYPSDGALQLCEILHCTGQIVVQQVSAFPGGSTVRAFQLTDNECGADVAAVVVEDRSPWPGLGFDSKAVSVVGCNRNVQVRSATLLRPAPKSAWWCRVNGYVDPASPPPPAPTLYRRPFDTRVESTSGVGLEVLYADRVRVGAGVVACKYDAATVTDFASECPRTYDRRLGGDWSDPLPE